MWGPEGGIVLGFEELAPTGGVNPSFALWAGLGVVGIGVAMTVARRREIRN
jgi:LPXTG-motif cell wall-anchored protein